MQRHGQFHRAQVRTEVAAGLGHAVQHELAQFIGQRPQLGAAEAAQIGRLLAQASQYDQWVVEQINAQGDTAMYLATCARHGNWLLNKLLDYGLIGFVSDKKNPGINKAPELPLILSVQQRENFPDWLLKLLVEALMLKK